MTGHLICHLLSSARCCFVTSYERGQLIQDVTVRGGHANKVIMYALVSHIIIHLNFDGKNILINLYSVCFPEMKMGLKYALNYLS